ncbi:MAG TPA: protein kinase [Candidatus Methylomirabilis sp.]|nr:protein kinase [Candidatus Methylomirabilis sp.]
MIGQTLGHYRILEQVGSGGMGVVYRARDEQLERDVALKVLPSGTLSDETSRRHFRKEALALAKISHPNIETVYEFASQDGMDFLVMEYVPGKTLADKLATGALPEKEVVSVGMQVVSGLEEAHERGIVHRDLKPKNIAITPKGQVKILDFGLAKLLPKPDDVTTDVHSETQAGAGTLPYMPPEQLQGESVDARADIYTMGAVLYEMATNSKAVSEIVPSRLIEAVLHRPPIAPRSINSRVSPELERIILKCLDKEPARRYQTARELLVDLRRLDSGSTPLPIPAPQPRPRSFWVRAAAPVKYAAAIVLTLAVAATATNFRGWRDRALGRPRAPQIHSLAVLPLENRSGDPEQEYFADGMTDELITELAKINALKVISRTSVMVYRHPAKPLPEIAKALGVDAVVEGSVQRVGQRVKISVRLFQARNEQKLWSGDYEKDLSDVFSLQHQVAEAIAGSIELTLEPSDNVQSRHVVDPEAHEAYLKGLYYWNKRTPEGLKKALQYFQQAVDKDPDYALAYAGLSKVYAFAPELGLPSEVAKDRQKATALKAVQLDDSLAEAHTSLAGALQNDWKWNDAELQYKRAIQLNPNYATARHWYSIYLSVLGRHEEAISEATHALELDPLSLIIQANLGGRYLRAGHPDDAIRECKKALEMDSDFAVGHDCLGFAYLQKGQPQEAVAELQTSMRLSKGAPQSVSALGYAYAVSGKTDEAMAIINQLKHSTQGDYLPAYYIAIVETGLGKKGEAIAFLESAFRNRSGELPEAKTESMLESLRTDPRFRSLIDRMGLPPL